MQWISALKSVQIQKLITGGALQLSFFDQHDNRRLELPIVLPAKASRDMVRSAGLAASWFGTLADYRSARFPVSFDTLPLLALTLARTGRVQEGRAQIERVRRLTSAEHWRGAEAKIGLAAGALDLAAGDIERGLEHLDRRTGQRFGCMHHLRLPQK